MTEPEGCKRYPSLSIIESQHGAVKTNIQPKLAKSYVPISTTALTLSQSATELVAADTLRFGNSIYEDYEHGEIKESLKTGASIAGAWAGGYIGGSAGMSSGAALGATVGSLFGGVGIAPGAMIGSLVGSIAGSVGGSLAGSLTAEKIASNPNFDHDLDGDEMFEIIKTNECTIEENTNASNI